MGGFWFADDFICVVLCRIVLVSGWFDFRGSGFGVVGVGCGLPGGLICAGLL